MVCCFQWERVFPKQSDPLSPVAHYSGIGLSLLLFILSCWPVLGQDGSKAAAAADFAPGQALKLELRPVLEQQIEKTKALCAKLQPSK